MFSGSWKESNETRVTLDIPDLNITREGVVAVVVVVVVVVAAVAVWAADIIMYCISVALNIAFSSLYRDEFPLDEVQMCSIVAASSMLQLVSRLMIATHTLLR